MAKNKQKPVATTVAPEQKPAEQPALTPQQLMSELQAALTKGDFKAVAQISRKIDQITKATEKAELEAKLTALKEISDTVANAIIEAVTPFVDSGQLDVADGVWFSYDFGEQAPTIRLTKTTARTPRAGGGGTGKKFDISTDDMLAKHGEEDYKDGQSFKQAYDSNTDKNWRYAIRTKLLKLEGII